MLAKCYNTKVQGLQAPIVMMSIFVDGDVLLQGFPNLTSYQIWMPFDQVVETWIGRSPWNEIKWSTWHALKSPHANSKVVTSQRRNLLEASSFSIVKTAFLSDAACSAQKTN